MQRESPSDASIPVLQEVTTDTPEIDAREELFQVEIQHEPAALVRPCISDDGAAGLEPVRKLIGEATLVYDFGFAKLELIR
jgi:hypothetical protein